MKRNVLKMYKTKMEKSLVLLCVSIVGLQVTQPTLLMNDVALFDESRNIMWFPSVLNMGKLGVIYPEGTENEWVYKLAQVRPLTELEKKDDKYQGHDQILDVENAETFGQYEFLEACQKMGIIKELD